MNDLLIDTACIDSLYKVHVVKYQLKVVVEKSRQDTAAHSTEYVYSPCRTYLFDSRVKDLGVDLFKRSADTIHILRQRIFQNTVIADTIICDIDTLYGSKTVLYQRLKTLLQFGIALKPHFYSKTHYRRLTDIHGVSKL